MHQADTRGLLLGVGPAGEKFPQLCGLKQRRLRIDAKCDLGECQNYCNFRLAPPDNCFKMNDLLAKHMKDIPKPRPEYVESLPTPRGNGNTGEQKKGGGDGKQSTGYETEEEKGTATKKKNGNFAISLSIAPASVLLSIFSALLMV